MRTVKQVSILTGISVRTLHYYDEIGLLSPSEVTEAGYRLYNDATLERLQQILLFKELDFPLKEIRQILQSPKYDKNVAFEKQKRLIQAKRNRLDGLLELLDKLAKGEKSMSFKEFDLSPYFAVLEEFKETHPDEISKRWGSAQEFDKIMEGMKAKEAKLAQSAIKIYGSIEKYADAIKHNLDQLDYIDSIQANADEYIGKSNELFQRLTADLSKDVACEEIKKIVEEIKALSAQINGSLEMGENYWSYMAEAYYLTNPVFIETIDKKYGQGASEFIGRALQAHGGELK